METNPPAIYLEHIDASRNMARFYHLFLRNDLFGTIVAVRCWGRIGQSGRELTWPCASVTEAVEQIECFAKVKRRRGYRDLLCISPAATD